MTTHDAVHVMFARPVDILGGQAAMLPPSLDDADLAHVRRFRFDRDREVAAASRWLQRFTLAHAAGPDGPDPAALRFATDDHGRPWVQAPASMAGWCFSASNTHGLVACAASPCHAVGLDVESVARALAPELVAHCCSDAERDVLQALPEAERPRSFHGLWTRKEAYLKARGIGLALEPRRIGFAGQENGRLRVLLDGCAQAAGGWDVMDLPAGQAHAAALCLPASTPQTVAWRVVWVARRAAGVVLAEVP